MLRRLTLGALLGLVVAALLLARRSEALPSYDYMPEQVVLTTPAYAGAETLVLDEVEDGFLAPVTAAARPFTHMLLRWEANHPDDALLQLEVRASLDGEDWSDWGELSENDDLWVPEDGPEVFWSQELYAGAGMQFWQVRVQVAPNEAGEWPSLRRIEVNSVDARFGPAEPLQERDAPAEARERMGRPPVVSRTAWGSPDGQGSRATPAYRSVTHLVVHHTAEGNSLRPGQVWADRVRAIWTFHTITRGWGDIGYNYLIDPNGVIYEGRAGGDDAVGFHDTANFGSMGVAVIGTYSHVDPPPAAMNSLVNLLAWKAAQRKIDPLGRSYYHGCAISSLCRRFTPSAILPNIAGHRDVTPEHTTCPGDRLADRLPEVRQRVHAMVANLPPPVNLELSAVRYERTSLPAGELLKVIFTIHNTGGLTVTGQAPEAAPLGLVATGLGIEESHVYDEGECFLSAPGFPKEEGRFRVMLGPVEDARQPACPEPTGGYPWRWGISGSLAPGEQRELVGYVRLRTPGEVTLRAGVIHEYVAYTAQDVARTRITVDQERQVPLPAAYDQHLQPLVHVYRLGRVPTNLLARSNDPTTSLRGDYVGSFAWDGSERQWGEHGPLPGSENFVSLEQTRVFEAPITGTYTFEVSTNGAAWLWINGETVVAHANHGVHSSSSGSIELTAGPHVLAFKMFTLTGAPIAGYRVQPPDHDHFINVSEGLLTEAEGQFGNHFRSLAALNLAADDLGGGGIAEFLVALNDGPWQSFRSPLVQIEAEALPPGPNLLRYRAIDQAGNWSAEHHLQIVIEPEMEEEQGEEEGEEEEDEEAQEVQDAEYTTYLPLVVR
ncbi:N-acetylmuramoyl-L-alanine amidase [Candidatus Viridilinea mediisalina]|uniref:PA14 domain-containing protein n=1 Tax=Candidatus Viridilinea mediisalina TaxID=2024553 RepID=A0A2A6RFY2_9CHLR|nr:N-acetylmuramoyl-L-alanine amidase [Candidatus Viridilinea mediisalina]PDW01789.1 hypothetical protein CJ255_17270 [Candidatus Viridilinea mediisalina]